MGERERLLKVLKDGVEDVGDPGCFYIMDALRIAELDDKALAAEQKRNRELTRQVEQLQKIVKACEFDPHGYCPICGGWECEKGRGCTPRKHTKDCALVAALTAPPSSSDPGRADTGREET